MVNMEEYEYIIEKINKAEIIGSTQEWAGK